MSYFSLILPFRQCACEMRSFLGASLFNSLIHERSPPKVKQSFLRIVLLLIAALVGAVAGMVCMYLQPAAHEGSAKLGLAKTGSFKSLENTFYIVEPATVLENLRRLSFYDAATIKACNLPTDGRDRAALEYQILASPVPASSWIELRVRSFKGIDAVKSCLDAIYALTTAPQYAYLDEFDGTVMARLRRLDQESEAVQRHSSPSFVYIKPFHVNDIQLALTRDSLRKYLDDRKNREPAMFDVRLPSATSPKSSRPVWLGAIAGTAAAVLGYLMLAVKQRLGRRHRPDQPLSPLPP